MSKAEKRLINLNERLNSAGYNTLDPNGLVGNLITNPRETNAYLQIDCMLNCATENNSSECDENLDNKDVNGALLCLTDGVLQLHSQDEARRFLQMLFQTCIAESSLQHRRKHYHHFLSRQDSSDINLKS